MRSKVVLAAALLGALAVVGGVSAFAWQVFSGGDDEKAGAASARAASGRKGAKAQRDQSGNSVEEEGSSERPASGSGALVATAAGKAATPAAGTSAAGTAPRAASPGVTAAGQAARPWAMADSPAPSPDATAEPELIGRDDKGNPIWAVAEEGADLEAAAAPTQGLVPGQAQEPNCTAGMVDTGNYCIDMTEVTNKAYNLFLAAKVSRKLQPPYCSWNPDFTPAKGFPPDNDLPVVGVDWCDARAYCQWAQKRMCGGVGGGTARLPDFTDATKNEWFNACSNGGKSQFPYGDVFDPNRCNNSSEAVMIPVGQNPACAGMIAPFDAILDMNGNVREWEDSCGSIIGGQDGCRVRGGLNRQTGIVSCATDDVVKREGIYNDVGIRCCADHLRP